MFIVRKPGKPLSTFPIRPVCNSETPESSGSVNVSYERMVSELKDLKLRLNEQQQRLDVLENNTAAISASRIAYVELFADAWVNDSSPYCQIVDIADITENSKVDLLPSAEQLVIFHNKDVAFVTENDNGIVIVYAIGTKPTNDYTVQVAITEVKA